MERKIVFGIVLFVVAIGLLTIVSKMLTAKSDFQNVAALGILLIGGYGVYKGFRKLLVPAFILSFGVILQGCGYERIDAGHVGVEVDLYGSAKGVQDVTLVTGAVWYNPFTTSVEEFPVFTQTKNYEPFVINAKDASEFTVDPTLNYFVFADSVVKVYKQYRKGLSELEEGILRNMVYDAYRIVANQFTSDSLMASRALFESRVEDILKQRMKTEGFGFQQITSAITPPEALRNAIEAKNKAVQDAMKVENDIKREKASAEIAITRAKGVAEAQLIQAKAEAEAYRMKNQALTPLLVQQQFVERWDGALPQYGTVPQLFKDVTK